MLNGSWDGLTDNRITNIV